MRYLICAAALFAFATPLSAQVHVRGYTKKDGTYVQPYERTRPNSTTADNYDTPGNYNPNKGRVTPQPQSTGAPSFSPPSYQPYKARCFYNCSK